MDSTGCFHVLIPLYVCREGIKIIIKGKRSHSFEREREWVMGGIGARKEMMLIEFI